MRLNGCSMARNRSNRHPDTFRTILHGSWCIYCGMVADSRDHFPPASLTMKGLLLPCCRECNVLAGTDHPVNFERRCEMVKNKLKRRYFRALSVPVWPQEELEEMGRIMRGELEAWQEKRRIIQSRLAWNAESYLASIDKHNAFADLIAECGIITECDPMPTNNSDNCRQLPTNADN